MWISALGIIFYVGESRNAFFKFDVDEGKQIQFSFIKKVKKTIRSAAHIDLKMNE